MTTPLLMSIDTVHDGGRHRVKDKEKAILFREICAGKVTPRQAAHVLEGDWLAAVAHSH